MEPSNPSSQSPPPPQSTKATATATATTKDNRDFLLHLESYLSKRDGVDKLLKISRYTAKILLSTSLLPSSSSNADALLLTRRLKAFDSSVGLSRKAFRLGKFIQDVNALRAARDEHVSHNRLILSIVAYGGEGIYYFIEQLVWLSKSGLIDGSHAKRLGKLSAWAELIGYVGSVTLKMADLKALTLKLQEERENGDKVLALNKKIMLKKMSILQDLADGWMAIGDIRDGQGVVFSPLVVSCAGLLSALISTHKNWVSC